MAAQVIRSRRYITPEPARLVLPDYRNFSERGSLSILLVVSMLDFYSLLNASQNSGCCTRLIYYPCWQYAFAEQD